MASFFRKQIVHKVISLLQKRHNIDIPPVNLLPSTVCIPTRRSPEPELSLSWTGIETICKEANISTNPTEVVTLLKNQGLPTAEGFLDIKLVESRGFNVVFTVDKHVFSKIVLHDICTNEGKSCYFENIKKKNILVHHCGPKLGEVINMTDFRHAIYSNFITNVNRFAGHNVVKVSHVNDWGLDAAIFLTGYKKFRSEEEYSGDLAEQLLGIKTASDLSYLNDEKFKEQTDLNYIMMEKGDSQLLSEWQDLKQKCLNYYDSVYKRIGVQFDDRFFDSSCFEDSKRISAELLERNIISENDGLIKIVFPEEYGFPRQATEVNSSLHEFARYLTSTVQLQQKHNFDSMHFIAPTGQKAFLQVLFAVLKKLNYPWSDGLRQANLKLVTQFNQRKKESVESILDILQVGMMKSLHEDMQMDLNDSLDKMAEELSLASMTVYDMRHRKNEDYIVRWNEIMGFGKDGGAAFELCYAGLKGLQEDNTVAFDEDIDTSPLLEKEAQDLILHLARFDDMVHKSYFILEPIFMYQYLLTLRSCVDQASNVLKIDEKTVKPKVLKARLLLLSATLKVLERAFYVIGIKPLKNVYSPDEHFLEK